VYEGVPLLPDEEPERERVLLAVRELPHRPLADVQEAGDFLDGVVLLDEDGAAAAVDSLCVCGLSHL
jgi:hypothetical protein